MVARRHEFLRIPQTEQESALLLVQTLEDLGLHHPGDVGALGVLLDQFLDRDHACLAVEHEIPPRAARERATEIEHQDDADAGRVKRLLDLPDGRGVEAPLKADIDADVVDTDQVDPRPAPGQALCRRHAMFRQCYHSGVPFACVVDA